MGPSFFISYAHADSDYVARLGSLFESQGLPLWYDKNLNWGTRFPVEIRDRIRAALAVIVLMSPAADKSVWVEREILEAQRYSRQILPILLDGERFFLLASSHYFDARKGALPGDDELAQLRQLVQPTGVEPLLQPSSPPGTAPSADLSLWLQKLRDLLREGDITQADIVTTSLLLAIVGRLGDGWMRLRDGEQLSFDELDAIDAAWSSLTGGRHGFRVQFARQVRPVRQGQLREFRSLASALDWKVPDGSVTPRYDDFVMAEDRPPGFFPTLRNPQVERLPGWHDRWVQTALAVHLQLFRWKGQG